MQVETGGLDPHVINRDKITEFRYKLGEPQMPELRSKKAKVRHRVYSEDYERADHKILDPRGQFIRKWSKIFLAACILSIFVDPLFFYLPSIGKELCIDTAMTLKTMLTIIRSLADVFYWIQIFVRSHTAYVAPSSHVLGRGELVIDSSNVTLSYLRSGFWLDLIAALPLLQVLTWVIIPNFGGSAETNAKIFLWFILLFQYLPRIYLVFPLSSQILEAAGVLTQKAWAGAAYNLLLFMLFGHVSGACWYLLSMQRQEDCWRNACNLEKLSCQNVFFDCHTVKDPLRIDWFKSSNVTNQCDLSNNLYAFGIYGDAATHSIQGSAFLRKYFYCLWWGLKNLSTLGQSFVPSIDVGENVFVLILVMLGLILYASLIGNVQRYLQSTTIRLEEWKIKRTDTEHWMHHRRLPLDLRQFVRKYDLYKWLATRGVDEEALIKSLPVDLHRKVKRHICFDLLRRVSLFDQMDETTLDAICERLQPALCTKGMFFLREGDPVNQMFFIIRGRLDSYTTNGGHPGFFNTCHIGPGDFCGEELLPWALNPFRSVNLPSSTCTVKAITEVEAFALIAEDLKFVASQFRRLHSRQLGHKLRFYSHQWRTWAACTIQAAWHWHKKLMKMAELGASDPGMGPAGSFWDRYVESLVASTRRNKKFDQSGSDFGVISSLERPAESDFWKIGGEWTTPSKKMQQCVRNC